MSRGFKNFLGIVLACIALSALFSSPVGFFDVVVAVMCIIAAILLLKQTESEKAEKKAKQSGNESKSMPTANTTDTAIETVEPTQITTQNEGYYYEPEPPVKPIVEHYSRNDDVVYLRHENSLLRAQLSTDQGDLVDAKSEALKIRAKNEEAKSELLSTEKRLEEVKNELIETEEAALLQSFGLYTPHFEFARADDYKARLLEIRARQKDAVKDGMAVTGNTTWSIDGSQTKGRKMVADIQKLLLRAFNAECDDIVEHVRYNNIESSEKRITASRDAISKLGQIMGIGITAGYYRMKIDELHLAFEWQQKKQQEKEEQREARAEMREAAKLPKSLKTSGENSRKSKATMKTRSLKSTSSLRQQATTRLTPFVNARLKLKSSLRKSTLPLVMLSTVKQTSVPAMSMSYQT